VEGAQELLRIVKPLEEGQGPQVEKLLGVRFVPMKSHSALEYLH
jgi:protein-L-isoaspartate(D-aspartate) O-methyltransferase